jgi:phosphatidylglycerophosphate synthase
VDIAEYRKVCQKNEEENYFFDKYIFRKISIYFTVIFIKLKVTANQATFLSLLAALGSCYFLMSNNPLLMATAVLLVFAYHMLDHVDGELARYYINRGQQQPSLQGQYFDVLIHKYSTNLMLFFLGISVFRLYEYKFAVILGFVACIGLSAFPNLMAAQVIIQKIAGDQNQAMDHHVEEVLFLLEKKREQIKKIRQRNLPQKAKKLLSELLFFPGCLILIMVVVTMDIVNGGFALFSREVNMRLLFLLFITPVYLANTVRQSIKWMRKYSHI